MSKLARFPAAKRRRLGGLGLLWLLAALAVAWGLAFQSPLLLSLRPWQWGLLLALVMSVLIFAGLLRSMVQRWLLWACAALALGLAVNSDLLARYRQQVVLRSALTAAQILGAHFIVGYDDPRAVRALARKGLIGGVFVTRHNAQGRSTEALTAEIAALQAARREAGLAPLMVATDQEGGAVSRLSPPLAHQPGLSALLAPGGPPEQSLPERAYAYGAWQGKGLAALGVNLNFSPVVDLHNRRPRALLDLHTQINSRTISADPALSTLVATAYSRGLQSQGVTPTLKHFPGLRDVREDTHLFSAALTTRVAELRRRDWLPFRDVATQTRAVIMLSHVTLPELDTTLPVSMSKPVVQGIIRGEWGHQGLLITDDMSMRAAYQHGLCRATLASLNAGVDLVLISYDHAKFFDAMYCSLQAWADGRLDQAMLARSRQRLRRAINAW